MLLTAQPEISLRQTRRRQFWMGKYCSTWNKGAAKDKYCVLKAAVYKAYCYEKHT